jgi:hypothetical protein
MSRKRSYNIDKGLLSYYYHNLKYSTYGISKIFKCSPKTVARYLYRYDLPVRTKEEAVKLNRVGRNVECGFCGKQIYRKAYTLHKYTKFFCSWDCSKKSQRKECTKLKNYRNGYKYKPWRRKVLLRDNNSCVLCGSINNIVVHHIVPSSVQWELRHEINNGASVCLNCHKEIHKTKNNWKLFIKPLYQVIGIENSEYR